MNPSLGSVTADRIEIRIEGSLALPGRVWRAVTPRALVAVTHGIGEHSGRYGLLASDLVRAGFTVVAVDLPGNGEAPGSRGDVRSWVWMRDRVVAALFTATRALHDHAERLPQALLGHSLGGLLAIDYAIARGNHLFAVILSAPALRTSDPPRLKLALAGIALRTVPWIGFPTGLDEGGMSRDPEVQTLRDQDPLVHDRISPRLYFDIVAAQRRVMRDARRLSVPTLVLHGESDRVTDPEGSRAFAAAAPKGRVRLVTYPEGYHEVFNDLEREQAIGETVHWLEQQAE